MAEIFLIFDKEEYKFKVDVWHEGTNRTALIWDVEVCGTEGFVRLTKDKLISLIKILAENL